MTTLFLLSPPVHLRCTVPGPPHELCALRVPAAQDDEANRSWREDSCRGTPEGYSSVLQSVRCLPAFIGRARIPLQIGVFSPFPRPPVLLVLVQIMQSRGFACKCSIGVPSSVWLKRRRRKRGKGATTTTMLPSMIVVDEVSLKP